MLQTFGQEWLCRNDETKEQTHELPVPCPSKVFITCPEFLCHQANFGCRFTTRQPHANARFP